MPANLSSRKALKGRWLSFLRNWLKEPPSNLDRGVPSKLAAVRFALKI